jgi:membrane protein implicated in regulation of membrane protease activity
MSMAADYWWVWMIIAAVFVIGEIFTAAFFLLWFGVGAAVAGVLALLGVGMVGQLASFVVLSLTLFAVSRRFAERFSKPQPPGIGADRFISRKCIVLEEIDNMKNTGRVRLDKEEWVAESDTGENIAPGATVEVARIAGTHLVVKVSEEGSQNE